MLQNREINFFHFLHKWLMAKKVVFFINDYALQEIRKIGIFYMRRIGKEVFKIRYSPMLNFLWWDEHHLISKLHILYHKFFSSLINNCMKNFKFLVHFKEPFFLSFLCQLDHLSSLLDTQFSLGQKIINIHIQIILYLKLLLQKSNLSSKSWIWWSTWPKVWIFQARSTDLVFFNFAASFISLLDPSCCYQTSLTQGKKSSCVHYIPWNLKGVGP